MPRFQEVLFFKAVIGGTVGEAKLQETLNHISVSVNPEEG